MLWILLEIYLFLYRKEEENRGFSFILIGIYLRALLEQQQRFVHSRAHHGVMYYSCLIKRDKVDGELAKYSPWSEEERDEITKSGSL